jgi:antitoxin (DNA-binding transcriptional repressor) of toxin-antitoxin stability system
MAVTTKHILEKRMGVRQFRDGLTRHLGLVRRGVQITVTDRGKPVAIVSRYAEDEQLEQSERMYKLLSSGHVEQADRQFLTRLPEVKVRGLLPSRLISEGRR